MPNFNATADLHQTVMRTPIPGAKIDPRPRWLESGKVSDLMNKVMAKRDGDRPIYSITVPLEAGFGKEVLSFRDIEAISKTPDFPRG